MIEIKRITRLIDLGDYAPEYDGVHLHVWVNLTRAKLTELDDIREDSQRLNAWYADLLSQNGDTHSHCTPKQFGEMCETDPLLGQFVIRRMWEEINERRLDVEKKFAKPLNGVPPDSAAESSATS